MGDSCGYLGESLPAPHSLSSITTRSSGSTTSRTNTGRESSQSLQELTDKYDKVISLWTKNRSFISIPLNICIYMFLINKNITCMWNLWNKSFPIMLPHYWYHYSKINIITLNYTVHNSFCQSHEKCTGDMYLIGSVYSVYIVLQVVHPAEAVTGWSNVRNSWSCLVVSMTTPGKQ